MSDEIGTLLLDSLERLLRDQCTPERVEASEEGGFDAELWQQICELELHRAALPEAQGGVEADLPLMIELLQLAASYSLPAPVAEAMLLAPWLVTQANIDLPDGLVTVAARCDQLSLSGAAGNWQLSGDIGRVPAGRFADQLLVAVSFDGAEKLLILESSQWTVEVGKNLAGEARDRLSFSNQQLTDTQVVDLAVGTAEKLWQLGAVARSGQLVGALRRAQELSHNYVQERTQFGRPLAKFQAIQQQLALLAADLEAASVMTGLAALSFDKATAAGDLLDIASAKTQAGQAAGMGARIAHQVHGAMGFTQEYPLHHATRRLWSWRDEYGNESVWATLIGSQVVAAGGEQLWPLLTSTSR
ncbi:MAG: acyl-CoA dehydrogenase family protein [Immundisolibacteraceae bacterium]|nr:acyl-CoA dehydrogenase family protein [Immundisolibacteraceae bacterium]